MKSARASQLPLFTTHEDPKDAVVVSHRFLIRAGYMKKQASGFYTFLPFSLLVQSKIEEIIRDELNKAGAIEVKLPVLTDAGLWKKSGRWDIMGKEMMRVSDRHSNEFALGPTHEEAMTDLASTFLKSYKQLPLNIYLIGNKYRDEIRPRYGLIRCREFVMKDGYSYHIDQESLDETYLKVRTAYRNIFKRCGLQTLTVQADSGNMGGSDSEEYMVPSEIGEETLLVSGYEDNDFKSNSEKTEFIPDNPYKKEKSEKIAEKVSTPDVKSVEDVAGFLKADIKNFIKAVIYESLNAVIIAFIPGDREINEVKLKNISGENEIEMASPGAIEKITGAAPGFAGPYGLKKNAGETVTIEKSEKKVLIYYDRNLSQRGNLISGGNETDTHYVSLEEGRDFKIPEDQKYLDLVLAVEGDRVPGNTEKKLIATKGIEVGHIFKLGDKYTKSLNITVLDQNGKSIVPTMGTYGIGVGRTLATVVEQNHDDKGIIWPESISPFQIYLVGIFKGDDQKKSVDELFEKLVSMGYTVYYDDRNENPGAKFHDAELVGFPWIVIAGKTFFSEGSIEVKNRKTSEKVLSSLENIESIIRK